MEHVLDELPEFINGKMPEARRLQVQAHLDQCRGCRVELDDLRRGFRPAAPPRQPLPPEPEKQKQPGKHLLSYPARMIAYAMSGLVVCVTLYSLIRARRPNAGIYDSMPVGMSGPGAGVPDAFNGTRNAGMEPAGAPNGPVNAATAASSPSSATTAPAPDGAPGQAYTNESLQAYLDQERDRMGIKKILPAGQQPAAPRGGDGAGQSANAPEDSAASGDQPQTKTMDEARGQMQEMAEDFERQVQARQAPSVKLNDSSTPGLLANPDSAGAATGGPMSAASPDSTAMAGGAAAAQVKTRTSALGVVVKNADDLSALWSRLGAADRPLPEVDFDSQMAVVVYAPHASGMTIQIVSAQSDGKQIVVRYRLSLSQTQDDLNFGSAVFPRSDLPVTFKRVPAKKTENAP